MPDVYNSAIAERSSISGHATVSRPLASNTLKSTALSFRNGAESVQPPERMFSSHTTMRSTAAKAEGGTALSEGSRSASMKMARVPECSMMYLSF